MTISPADRSRTSVTSKAWPPTGTGGPVTRNSLRPRPISHEPETFRNIPHLGIRLFGVGDRVIHDIAQPCREIDRAISPVRIIVVLNMIFGGDAWGSQCVWQPKQGAEEEGILF